MPRVETIRLFNKASRDAEASEDYKIVIGGNIEGIITSEFSVESSAQWEPIFNIPDGFSQVENMMNATGVSLFKSGIFTRKFYKGGSYLEFAVDFRVVDWEGGAGTNIVDITKQLISYTAPTEPNTAQLGTAFELAGEFGSQVVEAGASFVEGGAGAAESVFDATGDLLRRVSNLGGQEVQVSIGHWWSGLLVIESVNAKYSRERTQRGPLYADYSVKFSTREILSKSQVGNGFRQLDSRVTFGFGEE